jgi:hypothetical protein
MATLRPRYAACTLGWSAPAVLKEGDCGYPSRLKT